MTDSAAIERGPETGASDTSGPSRAQYASSPEPPHKSGSLTGLPGGPEALIYQHLSLIPTGGNYAPGAPCPSVPAASAAPPPVDPLGVGAPHPHSFRCLLPKHNLLTKGGHGPPPSLARQQCRENHLWREIPPDFRDEIHGAAAPTPDRTLTCAAPNPRSCNVNHNRDQDTHTHRGQDGVPVGILRTRWTDEGNTWRPWRQCILAEYLRIHLWPNGPSTKCSRSVATVTYAYRVEGIMREQMSPKVKRL